METNIIIPKPTDTNVLRHIQLDEYRLLLWYAFKQDRLGKDILGYALIKDDKAIFLGEDFHASPLNANDADETVRSLLCFLTLRPGDTDSEYFENYTADQYNFAMDGSAERLSLYCEDECPIPFEDI